MTSSKRVDVVVIGGGPAGVVAALRAVELGAHTALVTREQVGGMAASDGPVPVRALAQAARLRREARHLSRYGVGPSESSLDYGQLLARVHEVVGEVAQHAVRRAELQEAGVIICEHAGTAGSIGRSNTRRVDGVL
jgi:pyruvate/2-oxoglutarate dehydrogenase complex dihydrolipoamide dehydrogenase (E3) component